VVALTQVSLQYWVHHAWKHLSEPLPNWEFIVVSGADSINLFGVIWQVVSADELKDDEEYDDILEDMREECGKFGMYFIPGRSHNIHICIQ
jgi:hypothetical protein